MKLYKSKKLEVKKHLNNLIYNWFDDEKKDYSSLYNIDYPNEIKTEKLKRQDQKKTILKRVIFF